MKGVRQKRMIICIKGSREVKEAEKKPSDFGRKEIISISGEGTFNAMQKAEARLGWEKVEATRITSMWQVKGRRETDPQLGLY